MDTYARHQRNWRVLYALVHDRLCRKFRLTHEDLHADGPCLVIANHVTAWDPMLVAMCLREKQVYFVASEHLFRKGLITRILNRLVAPIPRRKGSSGADAAMASMRHLRAGRSVCIFAEGEVCWDGRTGPIFPATGKLAQRAGASLVTVRLEGGYLTAPRWGRGVRRGKMHVHPVNIYPPERLREMTAAQIDAAIDRDIHEDAFERQRREPVRYRGRRIAEGMERALFLCPGCRRIGSLRTENDMLTCGCGLRLRFTETGFFEPEEPFSDIAAWDDWQIEQLRLGAFEHGEPWFSDEGLVLARIGADNTVTRLGRGGLSQYADRIECAGRSFPLERVSNMAVVRAFMLMFSFEGEYYEIRAERDVNLRKYFFVWKNRSAGNDQ